jgi:hypothetical protein
VKKKKKMRIEVGLGLEKVISQAASMPPWMRSSPRCAR